MDRAAQHNIILDNAKFILIFLVIFGHCLEPFIDRHKIIKAIYLVIYSFHMPAFVMISGMLSRKLASTALTKKLIKGLLLPFLVFTLIYEALHFAAFGGASKYILSIQPYWILWFLPSLFVWRYTLPIINKIPGLIYLSLAAALIIGLFPSFENLFGLSRTIYFWPFFLIGAQMTASYNDKALFKLPRLLWLAALAPIIFLFWHMSDMNQKTLYGRLSYYELGLSQMNGVFIQAGFIIIASLMCFTFLNLTPQKIGIPPHWKKNTLYAYLWHGLAVKAAAALGIAALANTLPLTILLAGIVLAAIVFTALFSSARVKNITDKVLLQPVQKLIK